MPKATVSWCFEPSQPRGKDMSVAHDTVPLIELLVSISSSEAILIHSDWACLTSGYGEL